MTARRHSRDAEITRTETLVLPHVTLASVISSLNAGAKTIADMAPVDSVAVWSGAARRRQIRGAAGPVVDFAASKGLVVQLREPLCGEARFALTEMGREFAKALEDPK